MAPPNAPLPTMQHGDLLMPPPRLISHTPNVPCFRTPASAMAPLIVPRAARSDTAMHCTIRDGSAIDSTGIGLPAGWAPAACLAEQAASGPGIELTCAMPGVANFTASLEQSGSSWCLMFTGRNSPPQQVWLLHRGPMAVVIGNKCRRAWLLPQRCAAADFPVSTAAANPLDQMQKALGMGGVTCLPPNCGVPHSELLQAAAVELLAALQQAQQQSAAPAGATAQQEAAVGQKQQLFQKLDGLCAAAAALIDLVSDDDDVIAQGAAAARAPHRAEQQQRQPGQQQAGQQPQQRPRPRPGSSDRSTMYIEVDEDDKQASQPAAVAVVGGDAAEEPLDVCTSADSAGNEVGGGGNAADHGEEVDSAAPNVAVAAATQQGAPPAAAAGQRTLQVQSAGGPEVCKPLPAGEATAALPQHDTVIRALLQAGMLTSGSAVQYRVSTQQPGNTAVQDRMRTEPPGPDQEALAEAQVDAAAAALRCLRCGQVASAARFERHCAGRDAKGSPLAHISAGKGSARRSLQDMLKELRERQAGGVSGAAAVAAAAGPVPPAGSGQPAAGAAAAGTVPPALAGQRAASAVASLTRALHAVQASAAVQSRQQGSSSPTPQLPAPAAAQVRAAQAIALQQPQPQPQPVTPRKPDRPPPALAEPAAKRQAVHTAQQTPRKASGTAPAAPDLAPGTPPVAERPKPPRSSSSASAAPPAAASAQPDASDDEMEWPCGGSSIPAPQKAAARRRPAISAKAKPAKARQRAQPAKPAKAQQPAQPATPASQKAANSRPPVTPAKSQKPAQPATLAKAKQPAQPAAPQKAKLPAQPVTPVKAQQPAQPAGSRPPIGLPRVGGPGRGAARSPANYKGPQPRKRRKTSQPKSSSGQARALDAVLARVHKRPPPAVQAPPARPPKRPRHDNAASAPPRSQQTLPPVSPPTTQPSSGPAGVVALSVTCQTPPPPRQASAPQPSSGAQSPAAASSPAAPPSPPSPRWACILHTGSGPPRPGALSPRAAASPPVVQPRPESPSRRVRLTARKRTAQERQPDADGSGESSGDDAAAGAAGVTGSGRPRMRMTARKRTLQQGIHDISSGATSSDATSSDDSSGDAAGAGPSGGGQWQEAQPAVARKSAASVRLIARRATGPGWAAGGTAAAAAQRGSAERAVPSDAELDTHASLDEFTWTSSRDRTLTWKSIMREPGANLLDCMPKGWDRKNPANGTPEAVLKNGQQFRLWIRPCTGDKTPLGRQVHTLDHIPKGSFIAEYRGQYLTWLEMEAREAEAEAAREGRCYMFALDDRAGNEYSEDPGPGTPVALDARFYGNAMRYLNHSCEANAAVKQVNLLAAPPRLLFYATRDIHRGEELTLDYWPKYAAKVPGVAQAAIENLIAEGLTNVKRCLCSTERCRKWTL